MLVTNAFPYKKAFFHPSGACLFQLGPEPDTFRIFVYGHELGTFNVLDVEIGAHPKQFPVFKEYDTDWVTQEELEKRFIPRVSETMKRISNWIRRENSTVPNLPDNFKDNSSDWIEVYQNLCKSLENQIKLATDKEYSKGLQQDKELAHLYLAILHFVCKNDQKTENALYQSYLSNDQSISALELLADFLQSIDKNKEALSWYTTLLKKDIDATYCRKICYKILNIDPKSSAAFEKLVEIAPKDEGKMLILLFAFLRTYDPKNPLISLEYFNRATKKAEKNPLPYIIRYKTLEENSSFAQKEELILCREIARRFFELKQYQNAVFYNEKAFELSQNPTDHLYKISSMIAARGKPYTDVEIAREYHACAKSCAQSTSVAEPLDWEAELINHSIRTKNTLSIYEKSLQVLPLYSYLHLKFLFFLFRCKQPKCTDRLLQEVRWIEHQYSIDERDSFYLDRMMNEIYTYVYEQNFDEYYFQVINDNIQLFQRVWDDQKLIRLYLVWTGNCAPKKEITILMNAVKAFPTNISLRVLLAEKIINSKNSNYNEILLDQIESMVAEIHPEHGFEAFGIELEGPSHSPIIDEFVTHFYKEVQESNYDEYFIQLITPSCETFKGILTQEKLQELYVIWAENCLKKANENEEQKEAQTRKAIEIYMNAYADLPNSTLLKRGLFTLLCEVKEIQYEQLAVECAKWLIKKQPEQEEETLKKLYSYVLSAKLAWKLANIYEQNGDKAASAQIIHRLAAKAFAEANYGKVGIYVARLDRIGTLDCKFTEEQKKELAIWKGKAIDEVRYNELMREIRFLKDEPLYSLLWRKIIG
ncbi:MAG: hypothetical protein SNF33_02010 [Candidatus Algichlamydia australiensis]|nr:hypothetical protein [Chlamydiales bacterium]